jgi:hypothetical protein
MTTNSDFFWTARGPGLGLVSHLTICDVLNLRLCCVATWRLTEHWRAKQEFSKRVTEALSRALGTSNTSNLCQSLHRNGALLVGPFLLHAMVQWKIESDCPLTALRVGLIGPREKVYKVGTHGLACSIWPASSPSEHFASECFLDFFQVVFNGQSVEIFHVRAVRTRSSKPRRGQSLQQQLELLAHRDVKQGGFTLDARQIELRHELGFRFVYLSGAGVCLKLNPRRLHADLIKLTKAWLSHHGRSLTEIKINTHFGMTPMWRGLFPMLRALSWFLEALRPFGLRVMQQFEREFKHGFYRRRVS